MEASDCGGGGGGKSTDTVGRRQVQRNRSFATVASASAWQLPRSVNTRRSARIAREVYTAWCRRVGPVGTVSRLPAEQVQVVFNDMQLYPTKAQVCDMLQCAKDCSSSDRNSASYLTFGEFCTFATELKRCYERGVSLPAPLSKLLERDGKEKKKRSPSKIPKMMPKHEVFLGGSCNPTTWRQSIAIPLLKKLGITYYNPQVDQWSSELLKLEYHAKESASVLFYVINNETRNVAGIIEAAHLAGARRKLILVIDRYRPGQLLCGEIISQQEYEELNTSLQVLQDLVERQGIPVFSDIPLAINCTAEVLRDDLNVQTLGVSDYSLPVKLNNFQNRDKLIKLKEAFNTLVKKKDGEINLCDVYMACRILMNRRITVPELKKIVASRADCVGVRSNINFEEFCSIVSELMTTSATITSSSTSTNPTNGLNGTSEKWILCSHPRFGVQTSNIYDVFVGGCSNNSSWADDIVIPILKKNNLSYYYGGTVVSVNNRLDLSDTTAINNSYMILFYVSSNVRGLASMAMAAHYIGLGCNVVLCMQHLPERVTSLSENDDDKINEQTLNDYNRGRMYLTDIAQHEDIPVFNDIEEAVQCVIQKFTQVSSR
ncbi:NDT-like domain-containing protein raw isoform X2 [Lycorma delicatula]|uniref:NDT-like domain-containing protein raw isoform X2 n=1 Tax=Lycorma delicatula TaxID=130591 RepID=UPI003F51706A